MRHVTSLLLAAIALVLAAGCGSEASKSSTSSPEAKEAKGSSADGERSDDKDSAPRPDQFTDMEIISGTGFGSVEIGAPRAAVEDAFGEPNQVRHAPNELSGGTDTDLIYSDYWDEEQVIVRLDPEGVVTSMETVDASMKTKKGSLGLGSWRDEITETFPEAACDEGEVVICRVGREAAGEIVTDFFIEQDQVRRIVIGRIVD